MSSQDTTPAVQHKDATVGPASGNPITTSGKNGVPNGPNYGSILGASGKMTKQAMYIAKAQYDRAIKAYNKSSQTTDQINGELLNTLKTNDANAAQDRARYESNFVPLENQMVTDAETYASPAKKEQMIGAATGDVANSFDAARASAQKDLESFGINPGSTRYAGLDAGMRTQEAAQKAAAGTEASNLVDETGRQLRGQAVSVGRGLPAMGVQESTAGTQAGYGSSYATNSNNQTGFQDMGTTPQYGALANQGASVWGGTMNTAFQDALASEQANAKSSSGVGSLAGLAGGLVSGMFGFAEGGIVPPEMSPSRGGAIDDVSAKLNVGEFVIPQDAVRWLGEEKLHKLVTKAREDKQGGGKPNKGKKAQQGAIPGFGAQAPAAALPV